MMPSNAAILDVRDLSFRYNAQQAVLESWSASFHASSMTAITGPSGRGKSTLLYLLGLMLRPGAGDVLLDGVPTRTLRDAQRAHLRAHEFGFVFQDAALDASRTVLDNVTETTLYRGTSRRESEEKARYLLRQFGVDVPPARRPGQVSGGQAQRIALARALLHSPRVVLADEPTGNLDGESAEVVVDALRECASQGAAVVIVTHSKAVAEACDREVVI